MNKNNKNEASSDDMRRDAAIEKLRTFTQKIVEEGRARRAKRQQQASPACSSANTVPEGGTTI